MAHNRQTSIPVYRWDANVSYEEAARRQEELVAQGREALILCEHPATITLGTSSEPGDLVLPPDFYERKGIAVSKSPRGGKATYHGPGQLVCYPILNLRGRDITIHAHLRFLEKLMLRLCAFYEISAQRIENKAGAWIVGDQIGERNIKGKIERKIGFVGVRVRKGYGFHGCSINVLPQAEAFQMITPCGMPDLHVTSIHEECTHRPTVWDAADVMETYFFESFAPSRVEQIIA